MQNVEEKIEREIIRKVQQLHNNKNMIFCFSLQSIRL